GSATPGGTSPPNPPDRDVDRATSQGRGDLTMPRTPSRPSGGAAVAAHRPPGHRGGVRKPRPRCAIDQVTDVSPEGEARARRARRTRGAPRDARYLSNPSRFTGKPSGESLDASGQPDR